MAKTKIAEQAAAIAGQAHHRRLGVVTFSRAARGPLACSPPPPRVPAPPRFPVHLTALRRRRALADRAAAAQAVAAPPRPNPSARACRCRRRRRSTQCPCVVRVALCMCMSYVCGPLCHTLEPLSMIVDRYSGFDGSGGPRRRLVTDHLLTRSISAACTPHTSHGSRERV